MEHLAETIGGLASLGVGALAWKLRDLAEEVKSLRASRHAYGNRFAAYDVRLDDIERRLEKINGEGR